jgi:multiple sugar transport system substrate-binding protein
MQRFLRGRRLRISITASVVVAAAVVAAVLGTGASTAASARVATPDAKTAAGKTVLRVAYGSTFVFLTPALAVKWWGGVAKEFEKTHPNVTVQFEPIPGGYTDIVTKLSLLYRQSSTAPDVAELPAGQMGGWVSSGYLLPLDKYLPTASYWNQFPQSVKNETTFNGHVYAVDHGENTNALFYNIPMFKKAGIPVPWHPKNWADLISAAQKIHKALPSVWPIWLQGGSAGGTIAIQYNGGNLLQGSTNPTIFDTKTNKWVVDSPGLRQTFQFYIQLAKGGLQAPVSELLNPNAVDSVPALTAQQKMAIVVGANFYGEAWVKATCGPCWVAAPKIMGVAYFPTENGQAPGIASALGGWELAIGAHTANASAAWDFIQTAQEQKNMINADNWGGWVPPAKSYWTAPQYVNYAPPYQAFFATIMPKAVDEPNTTDFTVWGTGFNNATGAIIQKPSTTVQQAVDIMKSYVTQQLGAGNVETLK